MSVPNQKKIIIQNAPCDRNNLYCMINIEAFQKAVSELSGAGLALWCYLAKNQNGYSLDLSPADAAKWGIKRSSFYRAMDELTQLGYIKYLKGNVFVFCNNPNPKMELIESQNETQKNQVPKWDSNLMGSPKMRHTKSQNETWQSQNETCSPKMRLSCLKMNIEILHILQITQNMPRRRRRRHVILQEQTAQSSPPSPLPREKKKKKIISLSHFKEDLL